MSAWEWLIPLCSTAYYLGNNTSHQNSDDRVTDASTTPLSDWGSALIRMESWPSYFRLFDFRVGVRSCREFGLLIYVLESGLKIATISLGGVWATADLVTIQIAGADMGGGVERWVVAVVGSWILSSAVAGKMTTLECGTVPLSQSKPYIRFLLPPDLETRTPDFHKRNFGRWRRWVVVSRCMG